MKRNKRAKSEGSEFHSFEGNDEQLDETQLLKVSHGSVSQEGDKISIRSNAAEKTYWTRVFLHDEGPCYEVDPETGKPGIHCINSDLQMNELLF